MTLEEKPSRTSLVVQWLRRHASTVGGVGSIPGGGAKIPHAMQCSLGKKKKKVFKQARGPGMLGRMEVLGFGS